MSEEYKNVCLNMSVYLPSARFSEFLKKHGLETRTGEDSRYELYLTFDQFVDLVRTVKRKEGSPRLRIDGHKLRDVYAHVRGDGLDSVVIDFT